jgi:hypothetical protein
MTTTLVQSIYYQEAAVADEEGAIYAALRSLLRSWLDHSRRSLLDLYDLTPRRLTLGQLAPLHIHHNGSQGQAFEWAVHEAINDPRRDEVRGLVADAMTICGMRTRDPRSTLFAQEKFSNEEFVEALFATLGDDARLRLYRRPGRPYNLRPLAEEIRRKGLRALDGGPLSMLPRADLLLNEGDQTAFIAASCKHNPRDVEDWPGVPIWITADTWIGRRRDPLLVDDMNGKVVVTLPVDGMFITSFEAAETILMRVCLELCGRSSRGVGALSLLAARIARRLGQQADRSVLDIADWCDELAQPGLIAVGVNDSMSVPAPSWLGYVRQTLANWFGSEPSLDFVDIPHALSI